MPHGHPPGWAPLEIGLFIDHHLLDRPALPVLSEPQLADDHLTAQCTTPGKLTSAALHYTTGLEAINKRAWKTLPATLSGSSLTFPLPPPEATLWFITATDDRQATVSSSVTIKQTP